MHGGVTRWHGSSPELAALREALDHHCQCTMGAGICSTHALLFDQRSLDRLLFVLRTANYWREREHAALSDDC